ncbi:MAG TPA: sugar ABC transporter ATP-binding protein [Thermoleophilaceae bacterium]|nr:sugar ABC transporter ATP-binding protein [Thermoleophilaceae bacterium]
MSAFLELRNVSKRFGGVLALDDISLAIARGGVHGLVGENGAGKSTLGKIIAGEYKPDSGELLLEGEAVHYARPREALAQGITYVAQELSLVPARSVFENVLLGSERTRFGFLRDGLARDRYEEAAERLGFRLDPRVPVGRLSVADQQKVELMRAIARRARMIVMDEPTAALSPHETERLLEAVRRLAAGGTTIVFVSHFLREVLSVCDDVTVLKDGRHVMTVPAATTTADQLVVAMIGRQLEGSYPEKQMPPEGSPVVFKASGVRLPGAMAGIDLEVRRGEILGLAGLVGSGRTELCRALFGLERAAGEFFVDGEPRSLSSPREAIAAGIAMLPESRRDQGLVMRRPIRDNVTLAHLDRFGAGGFIRRADERAAVGHALAQVGVDPGRNQGNVVNLSGGNQQRVLFAKWLLDTPKLLIADEPTRGVDVGAKRAIYDLLVELAAKGMAIILVSSEIEEVLGLAHRVAVMRHGQIVGELHGPDIGKEAVMRVAFGSDAASAAA